MATTAKAVLDVIAATVVAYPPANLASQPWRRLDDVRDARVESSGFRLLLPSVERSPDFGVDRQETLTTRASLELYRSSQAEDDASFFAEVSGIANAVEAASYPSGTLAVIARSRTVSRQYADPSWIVGSVEFQITWEQAY